jgi:hypothetical protein
MTITAYVLCILYAKFLYRFFKPAWNSLVVVGFFLAFRATARFQRHLILTATSAGHTMYLIRPRYRGDSASMEIGISGPYLQ